MLCQADIAPMTLVTCYPIGVIKLEDDEDSDEKIIAIPFKDPSLNVYNDILDLPKHTFDEISHFFEVYKMLENIDTSVTEVLGRADAVSVISECMEKYTKKFG